MYQSFKQGTNHSPLNNFIFVRLIFGQIKDNNLKCTMYIVCDCARQVTKGPSVLEISLILP